MSRIKDLAEESELAPALRGSAKSCLFLWASWHEPSKLGGQMDVVWGELSRMLGGQGVQFLRAEAEKFPLSCEKWGVSSVPSFALLSGEELTELVEGADPPDLASKVKAFAAQAALTSATTAAAGEGANPAALNSRIKSLIEADEVMLFMKGTPSEPKCKFSRRILAILEGAGIRFSSFNILGDEDVRQGIKVYSDFPTFPQLYVRGELIGGIDIVQEMVDAAARDSEEDLATQLGLSIREPERTTTASSSPIVAESLDEKCRKLINSHPIMLFMKGSPAEPRCGFSNRIVDLLQKEEVEFATFDILTDEDVRQNLKTLSDWPTYPQLYVKGELVGGIDIVQELIETGEFKELLS